MRVDSGPGNDPEVDLGDVQTPVSERLIHDLPRPRDTTAALRSTTGLEAELAQAVDTIVDGVANSRVGNGMADANVHKFRTPGLETTH